MRAKVFVLKWVLKSRDEVLLQGTVRGAMHVADEEVGNASDKSKKKKSGYHHCSALKPLNKKQTIDR